MIDLTAIDAQCVHAVMLALEAILAAAFLTFIWIVLPACRNGGPRR